MRSRSDLHAVLASLMRTPRTLPVIKNAAHARLIDSKTVDVAIAEMLAAGAVRSYTKFNGWVMWVAVTG